MELKLNRRMNNLVLAAAIAVCGTTSHARTTATTKPDPRVVLKFQQLSQCALQKDEARWLRFVTSGGASTRKDWNSLFGCVGRIGVNVVKIPAGYWHGLLSEGLYRRYFPAPVELNTIPFERLGLKLEKREDRLYRFADCAVLAHPADADAILRTAAPTSARESAALARLEAASSACASAAAPVATDAAGFRAALASSLFLRSLSVSPSGTLIAPKGPNSA